MDAPGVVHHIIARGVANGPIVRDDSERESLMESLGSLVIAADATCLAWCLMTTHLHLVIRTGKRPLRWLMQRLLLRHAQRVNARWRRVGHVFQNRYKALLVDEDTYLLALVRYVHRNPIIAGVVPSLAALVRYRWCGHGALVGSQRLSWQATEEVLELFSRQRAEARRKYIEWMGRKCDPEEERVLEGVRQVPQVGEASALERPGRPRVVRGRDERILGTGAFVAQTLRQMEGIEQRRGQVKSRFSPAEVVRRAADAVGVAEQRLYTRERRRPVPEARAVASSWLVDELGMRVVDVARVLRVSPPAVSAAVARGRRIIAAHRLVLNREA